jgi:hypothetical protein
LFRGRHYSGHMQWCFLEKTWLFTSCREIGLWYRRPGGS